MLQTYALYKKVNDLGYNCKVIDYRCPAIEKRERINATIIDSNIKNTIRNIVFLPQYKKKAAVLSGFTTRHIELSSFYDPITIKNAQSEVDAFLVGSDIVWGRDITNFDYTYFLDFVGDNIPKYAFSSSVGDYSEKGDEEKVSKMLHRFNSIAVREKDSIVWLQRMNIENAYWVCDPTMLLTKDEWNDSITPKNYKSKYVLVYFLDDNKKNLEDAKRYAQRTGCEVFLINYDRPLGNVRNISPKSLEEFLGLVLNAQMVFTASYHGMLFSLYYNKQFMFYTRAHKSRVLSLADRLGVETCCGDNADIFNYRVIDYNSVNNKINEFREESIETLRTMLER